MLERFEDYYDPERPKLDKVTITPIIDAEPLAAAIEAGDIQLIGGNPIAPEIVDRFLQNPDLVVSIVPGPTFQSVWMNPWREPFVVSDFNKPLEELMQENGFKVRLAIAKALDRDALHRAGAVRTRHAGLRHDQPGDGHLLRRRLGRDQQPALRSRGGQAPARRGRISGRRGIPAAARSSTPRISVARSRSSPTSSSTNLGIDARAGHKDFPVLIEAFDKMDFDLVRLGSGGDYDPDDGLVDWMQTSSKFNGRLRDKDKMPFGVFSDARVDELIEQQRLETDPEQRKALVQEANKITSDKVASAFLFHQMDILVHHNERELPAGEPYPGPGRPRPHDALLTLTDIAEAARGGDAAARAREREARMSRYLIRRILGAIVVMWAVATLVFFMLRAVPGDPIAAMLFDVGDPRGRGQIRQQVRARSAGLGAIRQMVRPDAAGRSRAPRCSAAGSRCRGSSPRRFRAPSRSPPCRS